MSGYPASSNDTIKIKQRRSFADTFSAIIESISLALAIPGISRSPQTLTDFTANPSERLSKLTLKEVKSSKRIGSGGFGDVLLLEHPAVGKVALKRLRLSRSREDAENQRRRALREGKIWSDFAHDNVLRCLGILEAAGNIFLVSPFMNHGSLSHYIKANPGRERIDWLVQVANALSFLHGKGVVHGDIKAANVLVADDLRALLCDFGLSKASSANTSIGLEGQGSVRWQSVELLKDGCGKTFMSDMWAFGMLIYEVLSGKLPFYHRATDASVIQAIVVRGERPEEKPARSSCAVSYARAWSVARRCWDSNPGNRGTAEQAQWDLSVVIATHQLPMVHVKHVRMSSDGKYLAAIGLGLRGAPDDSEDAIGRFACVLTVDATKGGETVRRDIPAQDLRLLRFSPDGKTLACTYKNRVRLIRLSSWTSSHTSFGDSDDILVAGLFFSPHSAMCVVHKSNDESCLVDVASGMTIGRLHYEGFLLGFSGDGSNLYYCREQANSPNRGHVARVERKPLARLEGTPLEIFTAPCSAFPQMASAADTFVIRDQDFLRIRLRVYDLVTGSLLWQMRDSLRSSFLSPSGKTLLARKHNGRGALWDVQTGNLGSRFDLPEHLRFGDMTNGTIATVDFDTGTAHIWEHDLETV